MPRVEVGMPVKRGKMHVKLDSIDPNIMEGKEGRPNQVRVRLVNDKGEKVSLGVPLNEVARAKLSPFVDLPDTIPYSAEGMLSFVAKVLPQGVWWWVDTYNGWVSDLNPKDHSSGSKVYCEPGTHRGYLYNCYRFEKQDGTPRVCFEFVSLQGRFAWFTAPWPAGFSCTKGASPKDDYIGPLDPKTTMWKYLVQFGLKWDKFLAELNESEALFTNLTLDGEVKGYFSDPEDICPELVEAVKRHGPQLVQWDMTITPTYGLGIQRNVTNQVEFIPVLAESDDFKRDVARMLEAWGKVGTIIMGEQVVMVQPDGRVTEDGKSIVLGLWRPVINKYPNVTLATRADGLPGITFPITPTTWRHDGVAAMGFLADKLLQLDKAALIEPTGLCSLTKNELLAEWAEANVPEFAAITAEQEEVM